MFDVISKVHFEHDCDSCLFLGNYKKLKKDIYYCPNSEGSIGGGSIIVRNGDEGREYTSTPASMALYSRGLTQDSSIMKKVAEWLLREGMIRISVCESTIEEKKTSYNDLWKRRK